MIRPNNIYMMWWSLSVEMKWQELFRWNMHFRETFLSCTLMFSFTRFSKVFLFCAIGGIIAVWFACFSTNFKRKRKRSLAHASTDHAKTKQKKNREKYYFRKAGLKYRNSGKSKSFFLNQRIHFDRNEHYPITIRNSFHDIIKDDPWYICSSCTQTFFKHFVQRVDRTKFKHKEV